MSMTTTPSLLPCPFCGGAAEIEETEGSQASGSPWVFAVNCSECLCAQTPWESDELDAVARWNRRAEGPAPITLNLDDDTLAAIDELDDKHPNAAAIRKALAMTRKMLLSGAPCDLAPADDAAMDAAWDKAVDDMSRPVPPADAAELVEIEPSPLVKALLSRIDAERARAESQSKGYQRIEAWTNSEPLDLEDHPDDNWHLREIKIAVRARVEEAEAENARLRGALRKINNLATDAPELNIGNYSPDQVSALNESMIEIYDIATALEQKEPSR